MSFDQETLDRIGLVCPKSKAPLVLDGSHLVSTDPETRLRYDIKDDIPIMLIDEATELEGDDWRAIMTRHHRDLATGAPVSDS